LDSDLHNSKLVADVNQAARLNADKLGELYDSELTTLINQHCPVSGVRRRRPLLPHDSTLAFVRAECIQECWNATTDTQVYDADTWA
jgi:hypothetical protein